MAVLAAAAAVVRPRVEKIATRRGLTSNPFIDCTSPLPFIPSPRARSLATPRITLLYTPDPPARAKSSHRLMLDNSPPPRSLARIFPRVFHHAIRVNLESFYSRIFEPRDLLSSFRMVTSARVTYQMTLLIMILKRSVFF